MYIDMCTYMYIYVHIYAYCATDKYMYMNSACTRQGSIDQIMRCADAARLRPTQGALRTYEIFSRPPSPIHGFSGTALSYAGVFKDRPLLCKDFQGSPFLKDRPLLYRGRSTRSSSARTRARSLCASPSRASARYHFKSCHFSLFWRFSFAI